MAKLVAAATVEKEQELDAAEAKKRRRFAQLAAAMIAAEKQELDEAEVDECWPRTKRKLQSWQLLQLVKRISADRLSSATEKKEDADR